MITSQPAACRYTIQIAGQLGASWVDWPCEVETRQDFNGKGQRTVTILTVTLPDQPALHGVLQTIRDLNLKLISVQLLDEP